MTDHHAADGRPPEGERIAALETEVAGLKQDVADLAREVRVTRAAIDQAGGGMKVLIWIGGLLLGGGALHLINGLGLFHPPTGK